LRKILSTCEGVLNSDDELKKRIKHLSSINRRWTAQLVVGNLPPYTMHVHDGSFCLEQAAADISLLCCKVPTPIFKDVLLGRPGFF
jgi:hypothetical protein